MHSVQALRLDSFYGSDVLVGLLVTPGVIFQGLFQCGYACVALLFGNLTLQKYRASVVSPKLETAHVAAVVRPWQGLHCPSEICRGGLWLMYGGRQTVFDSKEVPAYCRAYYIVL